MLNHSVPAIVMLAAVFMATAAEPATIHTISPSQGPIAGGDTVTLTGSGFAGTTLTLDGAAVTAISMSDTQITFKTPAHDNGIASVKLSGNGPNAYAEFLYLPPALQSLPPGYITTVMGIGVFRGDGRPATSAVLESNPIDVAVGPDGTVYFSEPNRQVIRRVRTDGIVEAYAGIGPGNGPLGDGGPAIQAVLGHPRGLAVDTSGNIVFADNHQPSAVRRIDAKTGIISTVAGGLTAGYSGDGGPASQAQIDYPLHVAFDGFGNLYILECGGLYVCDHPRIRKVDTRGIITTMAGGGAAGFSGDGGPALSATFDIAGDNSGLAADAAGNVYVADTNNSRVRKIDAQTGVISTILGGHGPVLTVETDRSGSVYVGIDNCCSEPAVFKLTSSGQIIQTWGNGNGFSDDGTAAAHAPLCAVNAIAQDAGGNILFGEACSNRIRRINLSSGLLETVAGMGPLIIGETGSALATILGGPGADLLFLPTGEFLTAEGSNYRIRKVDQHGNVSVFAGNGFLFWNGSPDNMPALQASMFPVGLARAPNGDILVTGGDNQDVSRIDGSGIIHSVTTHQLGFSGDGGPVGSALLDNPFDVAVDSSGNLYIADSDNNRIRRVDAQTGMITTVAGSGPVNNGGNYGAGSYCGDGGPATQACLNTPYGIAVASDGTMYIGENEQRIRKVDSNGIITTFFFSGGQRVRLGPGGNLFMTPYRIEPNGHVFMFAFSASSQSGIGDGGPASSAPYGGGGGQSAGIAIDSEGNLFFTDNHRIRAIRYGAVIAEPGSSVATATGTPQGTAAGRDFPVALQITLTSPAGTPENGIRVDFAAPTSGASCTFPGGASTLSVLTDLSGHASVTCTASAQTGSYMVTATPLALGHSVTFSLTNTAPPSPAVGASGILNGASFDTAKAQRIAPGALISIFGTGLAVQSGLQTFTAVPVPTQLAGTQVLINGIASPIFAVAGGSTFDQINAQVPFEVAGATTGNLVVRVAGRPDSAAVPVTIDPVAPAVFTVPSGGSGPGAIQHSSDFTLVSSASPAKPGETVVIYCTGLGVTSPPVATGNHGNAQEPFNRTEEPPVVTVGGQTAQVLFAGAAPCCAALYQINVVVPLVTPAGNQPVVVRMPISNVASRPDVIINVLP